MDAELEAKLKELRKTIPFGGCALELHKLNRYTTCEQRAAIARAERVMQDIEDEVEERCLVLCQAASDLGKANLSSHKVAKVKHLAKELRYKDESGFPDEAYIDYINVLVDLLVN